ncbi:FUSC family protein [Agarivorans litoreus]|uniref:FUSC family protein n=1 Tax=Agarivorans litoreus TaxID=1510455 RepID=UPI001C7D312D|nr:FUSC family protein [Agarivorans litoreus]
MTDATKLAIKVALSLALTIFLALSFGWDKPYWAGAVVVIMATTESYGYAKQKASHRLVGTLVGAVLAAVLITNFGQQRELFFLVITTLGAFAAYMSANSAYGYAYKVAFMVAMIVCLAGGLSELYSFQLGILRLQENLLGVVCFSAVFSLLWPESSLTRLKTKAKIAKEKEAFKNVKEGQLRAIKFFCFTSVCWALWIYLPIPGSFMFPMLAASLGISLVEFNSAVFNKLLVVLYFWAVVILLQYVFLLPMLESGWQLAAFYFVNCFVIWRVFHKPEQLVMRLMGGQFLVLLTMNAQHLRPVYDINSSLQMLMHLSVLIVVMKIVIQIIESLITSNSVENQ